MAKVIETVGVWFDEEGVATSTVVNYSDGDVKNFPGEYSMPFDEWSFMMKAKERDKITLSNGKSLRVWYN